MVRIYTHLASQDVEKTILDLYGIKPADESKDLEVRKCPRCSFINDAKARFCSRCGLPLTQDAMIEVEEWEKRKTESAKINIYPDLLKEIIKMQEEIYHLRKQIEELKKNENSLGVTSRFSKMRACLIPNIYLRFYCTEIDSWILLP